MINNTIQQSSQRDPRHPLEFLATSFSLVFPVLLELHPLMELHDQVQIRSSSPQEGETASVKSQDEGLPLDGAKEAILDAMQVGVSIR